MSFTTQFNNNVLSSASAECSRLGLSCTSVTWEDMGRMKNSCWGLNISDMTLRVSPERALCPVIRKPNFADVTSDLKINKFNVAVGNEKGSALQTIPLSQFLKNINSYVGGELADMKTGVFAERDSHILTSVQYCVLPIQNQFVEFNVALYNYNTVLNNDSAVLTIVASSQGTSVQTLKTMTTDLRFNDNGRMCDFKAQRLEDYRKDIGDTNQSKTLSTKEQEKNVLFVFQVPLKTSPRSLAVAACCANEGDEGDEEDECEYVSAAAACAGGERTRSAFRGMSSAILSKGTDKGVFEQITQKLVRDERFPIRCTIQYYMVTDQGNVSSSMLQEMKNKIDAVYSNGDNIGSLVTNVVGDGVVRPTESVQPTAPFMIKLPTNQSKLVSPISSGNDATPSLLMNWL